MELNEKIREKQMSENFILGIMLALTGGFLDAYTYITRGGVFANAQTGNIVLMGINLAKGDFERVTALCRPYSCICTRNFIVRNNQSNT